MKKICTRVKNDTYKFPKFCCPNEDMQKRRETMTIHTCKFVFSLKLSFKKGYDLGKEVWLMT